MDINFNIRQLGNTDYLKCINTIICNYDNTDGIILPNPFPINMYIDSVESDISNREKLVKSIYKGHNFNIVGKNVWYSLRQFNKCLLYDIVGVISTTIKYNTNCIKLTASLVSGALGRTISNTTYTECINILKDINILRKTNRQGIYVVNPLSIYKGDIGILIDIVNNPALNKIVMENNNVIIDKACIVSKRNKEIIATIIKNSKYHKDDIEDVKMIEENDEEKRFSVIDTNGISFNFKKRRR